MIPIKKAVLGMLLFFSLSIIIFPGCDSERPVKIGFIASMTGPMADTGIPARNAIQLAVEQCNEAGGIHGRRVSLIIKDDRQNTNTAVRAVQELIRAEVAAVIVSTSSDMATAIVPHLNESRVVAVGSSATTTDLSGRDDYFFRVCMTTREFARHSANYQIRSGDMRHITIAHEMSNRSFSEIWLESFEETFTAKGGEVLATIEFTTEDDFSFQNIARGLLAPVPEGIMIIATATNSALLCQHIRIIDPSIKITLSNWGASRRFIELGGRAVEDVTMPAGFDWESMSPPYQAFRKRYTECYRRDPGLLGTYAYNAARVVLTALTAKDQNEPLKDTLLSIGEFSGLQGDIRFDAYGDMEPSSITMLTVRNRKFVAVE